MLQDIAIGDVVLPSLAEKVSQEYSKAIGTPQLLRQTRFFTPYGTLVQTQGLEAATNSGEGGTPTLLANVQKKTSGVKPVAAREYFLNYTSESTLEHEDTLWVDKDGKLAPAPGVDVDAKLRGKAVIIGSSTTPRDVFGKPVSGAPIRGVYLNALAVDTQLQSPLVLFRRGPQLALDFICGLLVLGTIISLRWIYICDPREIAASRISLLATLLVAMAVLVAGIELVRWQGILWTDYFLLVLLVFLHPRIEHNVEHAFLYLKSKLKREWNSVLFE